MGPADQCRPWSRPLLPSSRSTMVVQQKNKKWQHELYPSRQHGDRPTLRTGRPKFALSSPSLSGNTLNSCSHWLTNPSSADDTESSLFSSAPTKKCTNTHTHNDCDNIEITLSRTSQCAHRPWPSDNWRAISLDTLPPPSPTTPEPVMPQIALKRHRREPSKLPSTVLPFATAHLSDAVPPSSLSDAASSAVCLVGSACQSVRARELG